jgi:hypothetical protein
MSEGANKAFRSDPRTFLMNNAILLKEGGMPAVAGCYKVNLRSSPFDQVTDENGRVIPVWIPYLAQRDPNLTRAKTTEVGDATIGRMALPGKSKSIFSNQFKAFYIPWGPDATHVIDLDQRADFVFTPGLTGCSFAATGGRNPRAGHFNYQIPGTDKVSPRRTKQALRAEFGGETGISIARKDYIQEEGGLQRYVFIVGWRDTTGWKFYRQHMEYAGAGKGVFYKRLAAPSRINNVHRFGSV